MIQGIISLMVLLSANVNATMNWVVLIAGLVVTIGLGVLYFSWTKSHQMLNAIPTIWTSLGILGTFYAIVRTLGRGLPELTTENDGLNGLVNNLVDGIIPAFTTSIIGIVGAILSTIAIKIVYAREEVAEEKKTNRRLEEEFGRLGMINIDPTPEIMLLHISRQLNGNANLLKTIINQQKEQQNGLTSFAESHIEKLNAFYAKIYEANKAQAKVLVEEYMAGIRAMLADSQEVVNKETQAMLDTHAKSLNDYFDKELKVLKYLSDDWKRVVKSIPESIDEAKDDVVEAMEKALIDQYNKLLDGNLAFTTQMLQQVENLEAKLSKNAGNEFADSIQEVKKEMERMIGSIEGALAMTEESLHKTAVELSNDMGRVTSSLIDSSKEYAEVVGEIGKLLPILDKQVRSSEKTTKAVTLTSEKMTELVATMEEIAKKNQQLRFELMQWKRVHKRVKINEQSGTKECPNCKTENPMDANFCRHCNYGFWDCETIGSNLNGVKK